MNSYYDGGMIFTVNYSDGSYLFLVITLLLYDNTNNKQVIIPDVRKKINKLFEDELAEGILSYSYVKSDSPNKVINLLQNVHKDFRTTKRSVIVIFAQDGIIAEQLLHSLRETDHIDIKLFGVEST